MSNSFHLAIPAGDLKKAEAFYTDILGCKTGNREDGKWVDIDFWGNELTLHQTSMKLPRERHDVDMGQVPVPHFGVHLKKEVFNKIKSNIEANKINYIDDLLSIPTAVRPNWSNEEINNELCNSAQTILGYVVRCVDQGIGFSKVPDINNVGLM